MTLILLLTLTLFVCGAYCGMTLFCQIGLLPAMRIVPPQTFAETWRAVDRFMDRLMPPFKLTLILLNLALTIVAYRNGQIPVATYAGISLLLSLLALVLTITMQLPVNKRIATATSEEQLLDLLAETNGNFALRFVLALVAFLTLCIGATHFPPRV